ncbi:MAG TPA: hypothetical protein VFT60_09815 [Bryobacteraceae bacterium]|nr:hypothetical protein [Bryobacteraceae bacterium]
MPLHPPPLSSAISARSAACCSIASISRSKSLPSLIKNSAPTTKPKLLRPRARVNQARERRQSRGCTDSRMLTNLIRQQCALDATGERTLQMAMKRMSLSDRAITDLDASLSIAARHIAEAIQYRSLDRNYWS